MVAYVSSSFPKSGGRSFILQTLACTNFVAFQAVRQGLGPGHVGLGCPFLGYLLIFHLGEVSERVLGPTHASSFHSSLLPSPSHPSPTARAAA